MSRTRDDLPQIVRSSRYEQELEAIDAETRDKAQAEHALDFALAREPTRGFPLPGSPYSVWPVYIGGREYVVYYRVAGRTIYLDSLRPGADL